MSARIRNYAQLFVKDQTFQTYLILPETPGFRHPVGELVVEAATRVTRFEDED